MRVKTTPASSASSTKKGHIKINNKIGKTKKKKKNQKLYCKNHKQYVWSFLEISIKRSRG